MGAPTIIRMNEDGSSCRLTATKLSGIGQNEEYLEAVIASHPELLELPAQLDGTHEPYVVIRQQQLRNALQATIIPDLLVFTASGHIVLVEVKLGDNPELRNRRVVGQIIDYASAFSSFDDQGLLTTFRDDTCSDAATWEELVEKWFPQHEYPNQLAGKFVERFQKGEVSLIVACDVAPTGLARQLAGVVRQNVMPFDLALVEILPYVSENAESETPEFFLSKRLLETEVVSRSVVSVEYSSELSNQVSVNVQATSAEELEAELSESEDYRSWSEMEVVDAFQDHQIEVVQELFAFCREESADGKITSVERKRKRPSFGFYVRGATESNTELLRQVFHYRDGDPFIRVYFNMIERIATTDILEWFASSLSELFPGRIVEDNRQPAISLDEVRAKLSSFKDLVRSLKRTCDPQQ